MSALLELADRCEKAEGPDRELDGWIYAHLTRGEQYITGNEPGRFPQKPIYGERLDVMRQLTNDPEGAAEYIGAPKFTASLDAAMTLVPEGHDWGAGFGVDPQDHEQMAWAWCGRGEGPYRIAATPALALCAAALHARAFMGDAA